MFIIWKTGYFILPSKFLLQIPPFTPFPTKMGVLTLKYNTVNMCSVSLGNSRMLILKLVHSACEPTMTTGRMGQETYLVGRSIQVSSASRKTKLQGSDLSSLSLYTKGSPLLKMRQVISLKRIYSLENKGNTIKDSL